MKKSTILVMSIALLAFFLFACGETEDASKVDTASEEATASGTSGESDSAAPAGETYSIGDVVAIGDAQVTVNSIRRLEGDEFTSPDEGMIWVAVDLTVENMGSEAGSFSSMLQLKLMDGEGYSMQQTIFGDYNAIAEGEIGPGRKTSGEVAFDVTDSATGLELVYDADLFGAGQIIWSLGDAADIE